MSETLHPESEGLMSFSDIAKHLGMSTQGVINIYNKAIEKIIKMQREELK